MKQSKNYLILLLLIIFSGNIIAQNNGGVIDKVIAVVGGEMIMLSDLEQEISVARFRGVISEANLRCEILENLLLQKLLLAQARVDSLTVSEETVEARVNDYVRSMIVSLGSEKAVEQYWKKPIFKIKDDARNMLREQSLAQQMQAQLVQGIKITPIEIEKFYKKLPKDSLPDVPDQYTIRQIVLIPQEESAKFEVRERLLELRERILNGERFSSLAVAYSEDPGSALRGGEYGLSPIDQWTKAFRDVLITMKPEQVSPIVETEYGLHIIQLIEKQGNDMVNFRHILMKPKYSSEEKTASLQKLDSIADLIRQDSISFPTAALRFSQDKDTRMNGGLQVNPYNLSSRFEKDQLNSADYFAMQNMKVGDISVSFEAQDDKGQTQYKIIQLASHIPMHTATFTDDYALIQQMALSSRQDEAFEEWVKKKQMSILIRIDPEYTNCNFAYPGWIK